jgi:hypothetical protein
MDNRNCVGFNFGASFENSCMSTALIKQNMLLFAGRSDQARIQEARNGDPLK